MCFHMHVKTISFLKFVRLSNIYKFDIIRQNQTDKSKQSKTRAF